MSSNLSSISCFLHFAELNFVLFAFCGADFYSLFFRGA